jgi:hypothetical protein
MRCALPSHSSHYFLDPTSHSHACGAPPLLYFTPPSLQTLVFHSNIKVGPPLMRGAPRLATPLFPLGPTSLHITFPLTKTLGGRPPSRGFFSYLIANTWHQSKAPLFASRAISRTPPLLISSPFFELLLCY